MAWHAGREVSEDETVHHMNIGMPSVDYNRIEPRVPWYWTSAAGNAGPFCERRRKARLVRSETHGPRRFPVHVVRLNLDGTDIRHRRV